jgi:hypothetical protein
MVEFAERFAPVLRESNAAAALRSFVDKDLYRVNLRRYGRTS